MCCSTLSFHVSHLESFLMSRVCKWVVLMSLWRLFLTEFPSWYSSIRVRYDLKITETFDQNIEVALLFHFLWSNTYNLQQICRRSIHRPSLSLQTLSSTETLDKFETHFLHFEKCVPREYHSEITWWKIVQNLKKLKLVGEGSADCLLQMHVESREKTV